MSAHFVSERRLGKRFVLSLALAFFGSGMLDVLASLFLVDIAKTFLGDSSLLSIAVVSQIVTLSSIAAVSFGLLNGFLSVKVDHKKLLLVGILLIIVGTVGCLLAPSLLYMGIFYPLDGAGTIIVSSMAFTLIGESLPLDRRAKSIGIVTAGGIFSSAIGFAVAGYIAVVGGWRSYLLWYVLPISLIALGLVYLSVPPEKRSEETIAEGATFLSAFKEVLINKSAAACLVGYTFMGIAAMWAFFAATFWINQFHIAIEYVGIISLTTIVAHAVGTLVGGRVVDTLGRKPVAITSWAARGLLVASIAFMPDFWSAFVITCVFMLVGGIGVTSGHCLNLEQVRKFRGTMMSLSQVFAYAGASLGAAIGGLILGVYGFLFLGMVFGLMNVFAASVVFFFAKDPSKS